MERGSITYMMCFKRRGFPSDDPDRPKPLVLSSISLHFFSGRRRAGDLQFYLDKMPTEGFILHTVSIDIVVDKELGNLMDPVSQDYWLRAIRCGYVVGLIGGPP